MTIHADSVVFACPTPDDVRSEFWEGVRNRSCGSAEKSSAQTNEALLLGTGPSSILAKLAD
jgi:hypothetical protein